MQPLAFCNRCRGMKVGWNRRYLLHGLVCREWVPSATKLLILTGVLATFMFAAPVPTALVTPAQNSSMTPATVEARSDVRRDTPASDPSTAAIEKFLARHDVEKTRIGRIAQAIASSSRKHKIDARLLASIMIVESGADPFAISPSGAVGIMQVHLPTWGPLADEEDLNLFRIEDNVDLGARILKGYVDESGLWDGVKRYRGWSEGDPVSKQVAAAYAEKIRQIYES